MNRNVALLLVLAAIPAQQSDAQQRGPESASAETDRARLFKSQGIRRIKGTFTLVGEDEAFRLYWQTLAAMNEANQVIALAGNAAARNQSIIDFQQRIAFAEGLRDQMRVEMRGGTTLEEQTTRRAAMREIAIAKEQRALLGQAGANPTPREAAALAAKAEQACLKAGKSRQTLVDQVYDVNEQYRKLGADSQVLKALGGAGRRRRIGSRNWRLILAWRKGETKVPARKSWRDAVPERRRN